MRQLSNSTMIRLRVLRNWGYGVVHRVKDIVLVWQAVGFWGDDDTTLTAAVRAGGQALDGI